MYVLISESLVYNKVITAEEVLSIWNKKELQYIVRDNKILKLEKYRGTLRCCYADEEVDLWNLFTI